jgi:tRNA threonylcarbamoyladenosine biosynthesis protein TsaE
MTISRSPADTAALGEQWGRTVESGLVIGLCGDLGAGKTQFVKGLARGLGIAARVQSPTFALVNTYAGGRLTLYHLDLYRLDTPEQIAAAGLEEYLQPAGVTVIEWAERWFSQVQSPKSKVQSLESGVAGLPQHFRRVQFEVLSETERRITYEDPGA